MTFSTLPPEIKLLIIEKLDGDHLSLGNLSACNKELVNLIAPTQWSHVRLGTEHIGTERALIETTMGIKQDVRNYRTLRRFTTTILRFPDVAKKVRSLDLSDLNLLCGANGHIVTRDQVLPKKWETSSDDRRLLRKAFENLSITSTNRQLLNYAFKSKSLRLDTILLALLLSLRFLERLEITLGHGNYSGFENEFLVDDLVQDVLCGTPNGEVLIDSKAVLEHLTHLKIECRNRFSGDPIRLMRWFQLPSLTHFFGSNWNSHYLEDEDFKSIPTRLARSIIHLEFRDCALDAPFLHRLLAGCESLETLIYQRQWSWDAWDEDEFEPSDDQATVHNEPYNELNEAQTGEDNSIDEVEEEEEQEEEDDNDDYEEREDPNILLVSDLTAALEERCNTLKSLELAIAKCIWHDWEHLYLCPINLAGMKVLTKLHIAAGYLIWSPQKESMYGELGNGLQLRLFDTVGMKANPKIALHDRLPKSLEILSIKNLQNQTELRNLIPALCTMLRHRQTRLSNLQELRLEAPTEGDPTVFGLQWLQQEADDVGVQLRIIDTSSLFPVSWLRPLVNVPEPEGVAVDWGMDGEFKWGHRFWQPPRFHTLQEGRSPTREEDTTEIKDEN
ncbi:uncharacterized protein N7511_001650 [Penicillium nucicola]|uniref:uncharacterized protein n=1 Tax=Penicillium nucicola TaxID=1850975 RepID=UPI002545B8D4|nr:uncharacterized protein N7511_001650 [Penicillium nucicola]KAJ5776639.1 hypothetical protein N7511_001650 [Penicillium nucicola]